MAELSVDGWQPNEEVWSVYTESRRTELTCTKLTQLHGALLVTRVSVTTLIGCTAAVCELQFSSAQFSSVRLP